MRSLTLIGLVCALSLLVTIRSEAQVVINPQPFISSSGVAVGPVLFTDGSVSSPGAAFASHTGTGAFLNAASVLAVTTNGGFQMDLGGGAIAVRSDSLIGWYSGTTTNGTMDLILARDAADVLGLRRSTNPQTLNVYNTFTDLSNYERLALTFASNVAVIGPVAAGTGSNRSLRLQVNGAIPTILFNIAGTDIWNFSNAGNLVDLGTHTVTAGGATAFQASGANGQAINVVQQLTELTTIAAAATTNTTIQMPANSVVLAVTVRTTVVIPTATSFSVGDSGSATRFNTANVGVAANSTDVGTKAGAYYNAGALPILLTMNGGVPAANTGRVRVTIYYYTVTPPSS